MAMAEDAASVLEQFTQDVANLPAEIQHLLEEIQAKDRVVLECRNVIAARDNSIQKFLKMNGSAQANPKEESYVKNATVNFDKAQILQEEKFALSDKAALLLDRQIKRLDFKIRDLQNEGSIQPDPQLPSLLNNSSLSTRLPPLSASTTGASTPLHPLSGNAGPSTTIANNPIARLVSGPSSGRQPSPLNTSLQPPTAASLTKDRSPSTDPTKRRRLNPHHLAIPPTSSGLRQSSLGPGTPKAGGDISRQSSAGPARPSTTNTTTTNKSSKARSGPPHQRIGHLNPTATKKGANRRRGGGHKKSGTPASTTGDEDSVVGGMDGEEEDVEMEDGEEQDDGDDKKYCVCHSVSYGNMVACDNDDCVNEWFHWSCVGVKEEPKGKWFCPDCREGRNGGRR